MNTTEQYKLYRQKMERIADVKNASAVLQWDQETNLPQNGAHFRGQQISTLSEIAHGLFSEESLGSLLQQLSNSNELSEGEKKNVTLTLEDYNRNKKYPSAFVRKLSDQTNKAFHSWMEARKANRFSVYEKDLDALISLKREEAELLGYQHHPYNALLDEFEKGATVALLDESFAKLLPPLKELLVKIAAAPQLDDLFLNQFFAKDAQWQWGLYLIKSLGFNFDSGRQDISEHPFSISFSPLDVRITTRIDENDFSNMTWSTIHETGHALYEQGLLQNQYGLPLGEACSYSIHESQSRLWENNVGRGKAFWNFYYPKLQTYFGAQFGSVSPHTFYKGINKVQPSLIRTEADEITYHFHVAIRYQLEKRLIEGSLKTADIPEYWVEQYKEWLGVTVPDDKSGCLQDVHWSHGSFGYFPTYTLGSLYAAQFWSAAKKEVAGLEESLQKGSSEPLLTWLHANVFERGRFYTSEELCTKITGEPLNANYFVEYLLQKFAEIYNL